MKKMLALLLGAALTLTAAAPAFAGMWRSDGKGWWYDNQDGTYIAGGWAWIDGNNDGIAECYYFGNDGYLWTDIRTPDGYLVNRDGQWIVNGQVQTQKVRVQNSAPVRPYAWLNGTYRAEDGRGITLDAGEGSQMNAAVTSYSEDGWNTSYYSGSVDENTRSAIMYYQDGLGRIAGFYQMFFDVSGNEVYIQTYDLNGNYVGSWYDGFYTRH